MEGRHRSRRLREVMGDRDETNDPGSSALGAFLVTLGVLALFCSRGIVGLGVGSAGDPGSKAFPIGLGALLFAGGVYEIVRWAMARKGAEGRAPLFDPAALKDGQAGRLALISLSMILYVWLLGPLGFASATLVFCIPWMKWFGSRWWVSAVFALTLVIAIEILFDGVFQVQLPKGDTIFAIDRFMMNL